MKNYHTDMLAVDTTCPHCGAPNGLHVGKPWLNAVCTECHTSVEPSRF